MKSLALLKKELRECLPWVLAAAGILLLLGFLSVLTMELYWRQAYGQQHEASGQEINIYSLLMSNPLGDTGPILLFISLGLGIALGVRQFWFPWFTKTWAFTLHRNLSRARILWIKLAAAAASMAIALLPVWTLLFLYGVFVQDCSPPPTFHTWLEGVFFIMLGAIPYVAAALSALLPVRWYTTRLFPVGFAFLAVIFAFAPLPLSGHFIFAGIILLLLSMPLFAEFEAREF